MIEPKEEVSRLYTEFRRLIKEGYKRTFTTEERKEQHRKIDEARKAYLEKAALCGRNVS